MPARGGVTEVVFDGAASKAGIAIGEVQDPPSALGLVDELELEHYPFHAARADLLSRVRGHDEAAGRV